MMASVKLASTGGLRMTRAAVRLCAIIFTVLLCPSLLWALCIKATESNFRSGPGTKYEKVGEGYKYLPLKKVSKKGAWYKVKDMDGDVFWIHGKLVTSKYKCAEVKDEKANIRSGPGTKYRQLHFSPILKYYSFKIEKTKGLWVKVRDDYDDSGWI
jgi:SH3-like domain-containing protein